MTNMLSENGFRIQGILYEPKLTVGALIILFDLDNDLNLVNLDYKTKPKIVFAQLNYFISEHNKRYNQKIEPISLSEVIEWIENNNEEADKLILKMFKNSKAKIELFENTTTQNDGSILSTLLATISQFNLKNYENLTMGEISDIVHILMGKQQSIDETKLEGVGNGIDALKMIRGW